MTLFDLLFLLALISVLLQLARAGIASVRGRTSRALALARRAALVAAVYLLALLITSLASRPAPLRLGEPLCSDEWCIAVLAVHPAHIGDSTAYVVDFRISSRARGRPQRELGVAAQLVGLDGRRYRAEPSAGQVPFDTLVQPGESIPARRTYLVPASAPVAGLAIVRTGAARFPRCCIIGDADSFLHAPPLVSLR